MIDSIPFKLAMNDSHSKHWLPIEFSADRGIQMWLLATGHI